jgi:sec-independent protein translocase protein TatA
MFGNMGVTEMLLIAVVVLLLFGAKRLPEIGASMGKGIREFKRSISDTQDAVMKPEDTNRVAPPQQQSMLDGEPAPTSSGEPKRLSQ